MLDKSQKAETFCLMNTETIHNYKRLCKKCGYGEGRLSPGAGPHWGQFTCGQCNTPTWLGKPSDDPTKYRRSAEHKDLVAKYSKGYCEMCLRSDADIKKRQGETMEAHHVLPYQYNGDSSRENIWIICTSCHKYIEHVRRYMNDLVSVKVLVESVLLTLKKSA